MLLCNVRCAGFLSKSTTIGEKSTIIVDWNVSCCRRYSTQYNEFRDFFKQNCVTFERNTIHIKTDSFGPSAPVGVDGAAHNTHVLSKI